MKQFTKYNGIAIQQEHLREWQKILLPSIYNALKEHCESENRKLTDDNGFNVFRGNDLTTWIQNFAKSLK